MKLKNWSTLASIISTACLFTSTNALPVFAQDDGFSDGGTAIDDLDTDVNPNQNRGMPSPQNGIRSGGRPGRGGCDDLTSNFAAPRIEITTHEKHRVSGSIEGICLVDAAYYDDKGNNQKIQVSRIPQFSTYKFTITPGKDGGEIRVHNSHGEEASYTVAAIPSGSKNDPYGTGVNGMPDELSSPDNDMSTETTSDN